MIQADMTSCQMSHTTFSNDVIVTATCAHLLTRCYTRWCPLLVSRERTGGTAGREATADLSGMDNRTTRYLLRRRRHELGGAQARDRHTHHGGEHHHPTVISQPGARVVQIISSRWLQEGDR